MLQPILIVHPSTKEIELPAIDEEREAPWKHAPYSANAWPVTSGKPKPGEKPTVIDFDIPCAGGSLLDYPSLCAAAKEFTYWCREREMLGSDDAVSHGMIVREFMVFCCALTHASIDSLSELEPTKYGRMMNLWLFGSERLLGTPKSVEGYLTTFEIRDDVPRDLIKVHGKKAMLRRKAVLRACGVASLGSATKVAFDNASRRLGLDLHPGSAMRLKKPLWRKITKAVFKRRQQMFHFVHDSAKLMRCATLRFDPRLEYSTDGENNQITRVPPPSLMLKLLSTASEPHRAERHHLIGERERLLAEVHKPKSAAQAAIKSAQVAWTSAALRCAMDVFALTAAMTARRPKELMLMRRDCLVPNGGHEWYVWAYIVKNQKRWVLIPVPEFVAKAIQTLIDLSPDLPPSDPLFSVKCLHSGRVRKLNARVELTALAERADALHFVGENDITEIFDWKPRQFRRFIPALHFWGYGGSVAVISHILKHFTVGQTWRYTKYDRSLENEWKAVAEAFRRSIAAEAVKGTLSGNMGRKLVKDAKALEADIREQLEALTFYDADDLIDSVDEIIRREMLVFLPKGWVICSCPNSVDGACKAMCRRQAGEGTLRALGPDLSKAGPTVCKNCFWAIENEVTRAFAQIEMEALQLSASSRCLKGTVFGSLLEINLVAAARPKKKAMVLADA